MTTIDYSAAAIAVRDDLATSHQQLLNHLTSAGTWWTAAERRSIAEAARAARHCRLCADRKAAISPFAVDGAHDGPGELDPAVIDTIHRIATDPGRLTEAWYQGVVSSGTLSPEQFVELVAVTIFTMALDSFARAVGAEPVSLPAATAGKPSRHRPANATDDRAWVPRLEHTPDDPDWTALYGERTDVSEVELGLSLVPPEMAMLNLLADAQYMAFQHVPDPFYSRPDRALDRMQTELVASRVSAINECFY